MFFLIALSDRRVCTSPCAHSASCRMSPELAEQLRDSFLDVERTVVESLPPISSNMSRKLLAAAVTSAGTCDCDRCQRFAAAAEVNNSRFAARRAALAEKAARQEQATAAEPAQLSPEQQQQASAAADRMAQLLLVRNVTRDFVLQSC